MFYSVCFGIVFKTNYKNKRTKIITMLEVDASSAHCCIDARSAHSAHWRPMEKDKEKTNCYIGLLSFGCYFNAF